MSGGTKTRRLEARHDPAVDDLITEAARTLGQSRSEFIVGAARASAERVLARADITIMSARQFDVLVQSLDEREPLEKLARAAATQRPYLRRWGRWCRRGSIPTHRLDRFDRGSEPLSAWLREFALRADAQGTARTVVWTGADDPTVSGYFSIAPTEVRREGLTRAAHGGHLVIPAYPLARLALDRTVQGRGLGTYLLLDAVEVVVAASTTGGGRLLVVDATDDAASAFYRAHDFTPITGTRRLYARISSLRAMLDRSQRSQ